MNNFEGKFPQPPISQARCSTTEALRLLEELHKERLSYDEYVVLKEALDISVNVQNRYDALAKTVQEVINGLDVISKNQRSV